MLITTVHVRYLCAAPTPMLILHLWKLGGTLAILTCFRGVAPEFLAGSLPIKVPVEIELLGD